MSTLLDRFREAKQRGDHKAISDAIPYGRFMGLTSEQVGAELLCKMVFSDKLVGNPGVPALHGGTIGALLEWAAIFELVWSTEIVALPKTISITTDYLRSGKTVDTWARGTITRQGKRVVIVRAEAWQEDRTKPIAMGMAHFLVAAAPSEG